MRRILWAFLLLTLAGPAASSADSRESAVALARDGMLDEALGILERLNDDNPGDPALLGDYITVLNWAGRHRAAVTESQSMDARRLAPFARRALAQSTRLSGDAAGALVHYQALVAREDSTVNDYAGYALALADAGRSGQALSVAETARGRFGNTAELLFAMAYAHFTDERFVHAISYCRDSLELDPAYADSVRILVRSLERLGATGVAARVARQRADSLPIEAHLHVANDRNASWVRWGSYDQGKDRAARFQDTDIALARLEALEREAAAIEDLPSDLLNVISFDKLVALRDRVRMEEAVALYERLLDGGIDVPYYAREAAADAYLYVENPDRAAATYESVIDEIPDHFDARIGLFYARIEQEDFSSAREIVDDLLEDLPRFRRSADGRVTEPDYDWLEAAITAAMLEAYADRLDDSVERLAAIRERAPHNARLSRELSTLYRWRGWARAALEEARIGRTNFPDDTGLAIAEAEALMDVGQYRDAEAVADTLFEHYPENKAVQDLEQTIEAFHSPALELYFSRARSTPQNVVRGEKSLAYGLRLDSAPLFHHSRLFAAGDHRESDYPEAALRHRRVAFGYGYRYGRLDASVAATESLGDLDETGLMVSAGLDVGDHLGLSLNYESVSIETPLRAFETGDYADRLTLGLGYDFHESRSVNLEFGRMDFTDGNLREFAAFGWQERWYTGPVYRLYSFLEGYASRNSLEDRNYFNPESDTDINLTLRNRWKTWRSYERSFHQVLDLAVGRYSQEGFDDGTTWGIRYEHTFEHEEEYVLSYGVRRAREFYDGQPEYVDELFLRFNRIF